jgi:predicted lipoprotein
MLMNKKWLKYIVLVAVAGLLVYNSVYIKKLDAKKATVEINLNPPEFAKKFWSAQFIPYLDSAVEMNSLITLLNPQQAFEKYAHAPGIGHTSFFLVRGAGVISSINEEDITVQLKPGAGEVKLSTGLYFGNAVRDVTGKIAMGDFSNTMDFNSVSAELNKIVREQVVLPFKTKAVKGATVQFVGCAEINKEQINTGSMQLLPVKIITQ